VPSLTLSNGLLVRFDDCDADLVMPHRWYPHRRKQAGELYYAFTSLNKTTIYMHRLIVSPPDGCVVDHINNDGLDNCRSNLRATTQALNVLRAARAIPKSGYRGVFAFRGKWTMTVHKDGSVQPVARKHGFNTPEEAARAYDLAALRIHGANARLNFPHKQGDSSGTRMTEKTNDG